MTTTTTTASSSSSSNDKQKQQQQRQDMMDIMQNALYRIRAVNYMPLEIRRSLLDFCIDDACLGKVQPAVAEMLVQTDPTVFQLIRRRQADESDENDNSHSWHDYLTLAPTVGTTCDERSAAINSVMVQLRGQGLVKGWRDEMYPVAATFYNDDSPPVFVMERAAVHYLGVLEYGIHINGIVNVDDVASNGIVNVDDVASNDNSKDKNDHGSPGTIVSSPQQEQKMWIARRSATKSKYPNMLDHIVAGGQPAGISLLDNCIKECAEEAGIPEHVTRAGLRPAGAISYETYNGSKSDTVTRAVLFCYDLHLPRDFVPRVVDGEVQEFMTWSVPQLLASLAPDFNDPIKPNCYPVMIDWLIRQGHLSPDVPGYLDVLKELRSGDCQ
jgi:isopentenyldiphosphate isomerase